MEDQVKKPRWEELVEAYSNVLIYLFSLLILVLPSLVWLSKIFSNKSGFFWVLGAFVLFVIVIPLFLDVFANAFADVSEKIRKGELFHSIFVLLRSTSSVLAIYAVFKLEYALVHGMPEAQGKTWIALFWEFLKTF